MRAFDGVFKQTFPAVFSLQLRLELKNQVHDDIKFLTMYTKSELLEEQVSKGGGTILGVADGQQQMLQTNRIQLILVSVKVCCTRSEILSCILQIKDCIFQVSPDLLSERRQALGTH